MQSDRLDAHLEDAELISVPPGRHVAPLRPAVSATWRRAVVGAASREIGRCFMAAALPTEVLAGIHRELEEAIDAEAEAVQTAEQAARTLASARARARQQVAAMTSLLERLHKQPVSVAMLQRTGVGRTVNRLRTHATPQLAAKSTALVRSWKLLVEQAERAPAPHGAPAPRRAIRRLADEAAPSPQRVGQKRLLDTARDDHGRVERRYADPDSLEDQLAAEEAQMAEAMWEEKMGGKKGRGSATAWGAAAPAAAVSVGSRTTGAPSASVGVGSRAPPAHAPRAAPSIECATSKLRAGYERSKAEKERGKIGYLSRPPPPPTRYRGPRGPR